MQTFDADITRMNLDCSKTWSLISSGNTKGCFQLESRLGRSMAKKLKPSNIEQLSGLLSILRPGCLEAMRDNKSVSNHYIDKKNGIEPIDYFHKSLEPILQATYGEMIYQEQAMEIARVVAGFNLQEADMLRKAIGKKKPEEMAKLKKTFLVGCEKQNVINTQQAEEIFNWIEKSQRYSFNKSHAISYAMNCYLSAFAKAHHPRVFFASYLRFAKDKIDPQTEIKELVQNAIEMDIIVCNPSIKMMNEYFELDNNCIYFGLTDIKGFGKSAYEKLCKLVQEKNFDFNKAIWIDYLCLISELNSTAAKALIQAGGLDFLRKSRNSMIFEYDIYNQLTKKEKQIFLKVIDKNKSIKYTLSNMTSEKISNNRKVAIGELIASLDRPPYSLQDSIEWLSDTENMLLGYSISCSKVDMYDISMVNCSCKDFNNKNINNKKNVLLAGEIENIRIVKTKKGKEAGSEMAFMSINDGTAVSDSIVYFPEAYRQFRNQLFIGNVIIIKGSISKNNDSLIAEKTFIPRT
jgi:DNA polymerase-3 subunit alpha